MSEESATHRSKSGANIGLISSIKYAADSLFSSNDTQIDDTERELSLNTEVSTMNTYTQESDGLLGVGKSITTSTNLAEVKAETSGIEAKASLLSAETRMEYGLNNELGIDLALAKLQTKVGPVQVETGVNLETSAQVGVNGVGASFLGFGFNIGPNVRLKTPICKLGINLF